MNVVDTLESARERVLACVGVNDIGVARLRMMMRAAASDLKTGWRMGEPGEADVLVLAVGSPRADRMANEARASGVRCVLLGGRRGDAGVLPVPFDAADLVAVLNDDTPPSLRLEFLNAESPDFFLTADESEASRVRDPGRPRQDPIDMDELFKRDPLGERAEVVLPPRKPPASRMDEVLPTVTPRSPPTRRNPFLGEDFDACASAGAQPSKPPATERVPWAAEERSASRSTPASGPPDARPVTPRGGSPLNAWMADGALVGPSRAQLPGQPELVLDPKHRVYHIEGDLRAAEVYVRTPLPREAWRPVTNTQLQRMAAGAPARPWTRLQWLLALRQAGGWLPRHLDPGGSYWLRQTLDLDADYDVYRRIGRVLMQSHRLHEVVQMAAANMQDVFDTVAAYDAIGMVQFTPRERLR